METLRPKVKFGNLLPVVQRLRDVPLLSALQVAAWLMRACDARGIRQFDTPMSKPWLDARSNPLKGKVNFISRPRLGS
jgi:hypothetical protein